MFEKVQRRFIGRWTPKLALGLLSLLLFLLLGISYHFQWFVTLEHQIYDQQVRLLNVDPPEDLIVVAIDEQSISEVGRWPWSRRYHGQLIELLSEGGALLVAYDVVFSERSPEDPQGDIHFQEALQLSTPVILPMYVDELHTGGQLVEVMPHPMFAENVALGHVNTELDQDGVVRSAYLYQGVGDAYWKHFSLIAAEILGYAEPLMSGRESSTRGRNTSLHRVAEHQTYIPFNGDAGTFQQLSFVDVINGRVPPSIFKDKIVFVGATALTLGDSLQTPTTIRGEQMPGVEINANIFDAIRKGQLIRVIEPSLGLLFSAVLLLVTLIIVPRVSAPVALLVTGLVCTSGIVGAYWLLKLSHVWVPIAAAVLCVLLVYPLWSVIRLDQALRYFKKQFIVLSEQLEKSSESGLIPVAETKALDRIDELFATLDIVDCGIWKNGKDHFLRGKIVYQDRSYWLNHTEYRVYSVYLNESTYDVVLPLLKPIFAQNSMESFITDLINLTEQIENSEERRSYDILINSLEKVRESQIRLAQARTLFQSCLIEMGEGVVITDMFSEILFSNKMADLLLSLEKGETLWKLFSKMEIVSGTDTWVNAFRHIVLCSNKQQIEARTDAGKEILLNLEVIGEVGAVHRFVVINVVDITRIKEVQRAKNETINFVSHDMRTPVVSLISYVERLSLQHQDDEVWQEALKNIQHYANKSVYFAEQFLQLAKVDNDEPIQHYDVDIMDVVCNAKDDVYNQAIMKEIRVAVVEEGEDFWIRSNGDLLERILINLLTNAIKYSAAGASVTVVLKAKERDVVVSVVDTGPGIPESEQEYLFKPFHRAYRQQGGKTGAGLGLRFVQVALKRLESSLALTTSSEGTSFEFSLQRILDK